MYRDGFGIRVDSDWLGLGKQWTTAKSYYTLKPNNTLGYVAISAEHNGQLIETTSREGFQDSPHFENFYALMQRFVGFTEDVQNFLRRSFLAFSQERRAQVAEVPRDEIEQPEKLVRRISTKLSKVKDYQEPLARLQPELEQAVTSAERSTRKADTPLLYDPQLLKEARNDLSALNRVLTEAGPILREINKHLKDITQLEHMSEVLDSQIASMREQAVVMYEAVGLGLIAEMVSHEVNNVSDRLSGRSGAYLRHLSKSKVTDVASFTFGEYVKSSATALRKQVNHLAPSLQYMREKRDDVELKETVRELVTYFEPRFSTIPIRTKIVSSHQGPFYIRMNQGKFIQVLDNLLLNSEYWLSREVAAKQLDEGLITVEFTKPCLYIFDNGRGIDPAIESSLFEPFISTKGRHLGRGLGLFIAQQLLSTDRCSINLLPERNRHDRRYKFEINLLGALRE